MSASWTIVGLSNGMIGDDDEMAIGLYDGNVFLIGGYEYSKQVMTYDPVSQEFTDLGVSVLPNPIQGSGQYYTQQERSVYLINPIYGDAFHVYDMSTQRFTNLSNIIIPSPVLFTACLASTPNNLFVCGGGASSRLNKLQILSLITFEWIPNTPSMNHVRRSGACIVANNYLWVFGGFQRTNERIQVAGIVRNTWNFVDSFDTPLRSIRCAYSSAFEAIYIIGGDSYISSQWTLTKTVHVVDASAGTISLLTNDMPLWNRASSPIVMNDTLYVFGGFWTSDSGVVTEQYAYYPLAPTNNPTTDPSRSPTPKPTVPSRLTCGQQVSGEYNNMALSFDVEILYHGDLTFDASSSNFVIQSLTAVFGVTPIASDTDHDGVLTISDAIPAIYKFTIQALDGLYDTFDVKVTCQSDHPTSAPSVLPTVTPTAQPTPQPTKSPSARPSLYPTSKPSSHPVMPGTPSLAPIPTTLPPSNKQTPSPTNNPTHGPTPFPTMPPTRIPSNFPSNHPTPRPTVPSVLTCGQQFSGDYNDESIAFGVHLPYNGYLTFDASLSTFAIQSLTAVFGQTPIAFDMDYDGILSISHAIAADYTFTIKAANGIYGTFDIRIACESDNPTLSPSNAPTITPTQAPTSSPTSTPTPAPTAKPTKRPTDAPIKPGEPTDAPTPPTPLPTPSPTLHPTPRPTDTQNPTDEPTNKPTQTPTTNPTQSPIAPPPTQPGLIQCGDNISGSYNNQPVLFQVQKTYHGDLQFDATRSFPLTITSLSAVFGSRPIGFDVDQDGIILLQDVTPGIYTFTIVAEPGPFQRYDVQISCTTPQPTMRVPSTNTFPPTKSALYPSKSHSFRPTNNAWNTQSSAQPMRPTLDNDDLRKDNNAFHDFLDNAPMLYIMSGISAVLCFIVFCITCFYCAAVKKKRENYDDSSANIITIQPAHNALPPDIPPVENKETFRPQSPLSSTTHTAAFQVIKQAGEDDHDEVESDGNRHSINVSGLPRLPSLSSLVEMRLSMEGGKRKKSSMFEMNDERMKLNEVQQIEEHDVSVTDDGEIEKMFDNKLKILERVTKGTKQNKEVFGKCTHMNCRCAKYTLATSKWSKGQCKTCNHTEKQHAH
eukprot:988189_1